MPNPSSQPRNISLVGAVSIGVGGMVGGGIFAVLGLAAHLAGGATPIAFLIAGVVALLTAYSYAKMSVTFPSQGGTVTIIDKAFGVGFFTGSVNNLLWLAYVTTLALYAVAFGNYAATFFSGHQVSATWMHVLISAGILVPTLLNLLSAEFISRTETYVVGLKLVLLVVIVAVGIGDVEPARLQPETWEPMLQVVGAGMLIFVAYEGFELIANTAEEIIDYKVNLPRAYYISVLFVIVLYVLIAVVVVGSLDAQQISQAEDFALAEAAKPSLGQTGFVVVSVSALLATLSAINATLYGAARLSYTIAVEGELPEFLERKVWGQPVGLLLTAAVSLWIANLADLTSISTMSSASFLLIFAIVNLANLVCHKEADSNPWLAGLGVCAALSALATLVWQSYQQSPDQVGILVAMVAIACTVEFVYQRFKSSPDPGRLSK